MYKKIRDYIVFNYISTSIYSNAPMIAQYPGSFGRYMDMIDNSKLSEYKQAHLINELIDAMGYF